MLETFEPRRPGVPPRQHRHGTADETRSAPHVDPSRDYWAGLYRSCGPSLVSGVKRSVPVRRVLPMWSSCGGLVEKNADFRAPLAGSW